MTQVDRSTSCLCGVVVATTALALRQHGMVDGLTAAARVAARQRRREEAGSGEGGGDGRDGGVGGGDGCDGGVGGGGEGPDELPPLHAQQSWYGVFPPCQVNCGQSLSLSVAK